MSPARYPARSRRRGPRLPGAAVVVAVLATGPVGRFTPAPPAPVQDAPAVGQDGKDVEWVPTPDALIDTMLTLADVTADDMVIDLGSGDGRLVIAAAARGARALGVEYDAGLVTLSRRHAAAAGVGDRATFIEADLFDVDLREATVVTMFLLPDLNLTLRPTLLALAPGTRIVSNTWDLGDWIADETVQLDPCPGFCTALLWTVPARVGGGWRDAGGALTFTQTFQRVTGTARRGGRDIGITDGRVTGRRLVFRADGSTYRGDLDHDGRTITGTVTTGGRVADWVATR